MLFIKPFKLFITLLIFLTICLVFIFNGASFTSTMNSEEGRIVLDSPLLVGGFSLLFGAVADASAVKVGIEPGSVCTTRVVAGVGVPQLSAIMMCAETAERMDVPLIADGGIRNSGDLVKALAAGASTVMIGRLLAGTDESPGRIIVREGRKYKIYRGMASIYALLGREARRGIDIEEEIELSEYSYYAEGVEAYVPYTGSASEVIRRLVAGLRSGMSYLGAKNIEELRKRAVFIRITQAGLRESYPHDVEMI